MTEPSQTTEPPTHLVCVRCNGRTALPPEAAGHPPEGPFVCSSCLVGKQAFAAFEAARVAPPPPSWWHRESDDHPLVQFAKGGAINVGLVVLFTFGAGIADHYLGSGNASSLGSDANATHQEGGGGSIGGDPALDPALRNEPGADAKTRPLADARQPDDRATAEARQEALVGYERGVGAGDAELPKKLPALWSIDGAAPRSPFGREQWGTDEPLTDPRVVVRRERLHLGGLGTVRGEPVRCAGAVEPAGTGPAVFVTACRDVTGRWTHKLSRVKLPTLSALLATAQPVDSSLVPTHLQGTFKSHDSDCKGAKGIITVTASTIVAGEGLSLLALRPSRNRLGTTLSGINASDGRPCSVQVEEDGPVPRLTSTCSGRTRHLLCK